MIKRNIEPKEFAATPTFLSGKKYEERLSGSDRHWQRHIVRLTGWFTVGHAFVDAIDEAPGGVFLFHIPIGIATSRKRFR
ncbi:hypothetical protein [Serratia marcescens]|uniref:hypothetical protein n=1 Tax=Serratia marcescens TaxID=615 RepID=UPI001592AB89|nr:hypothetical protein [Serratia marcescens]